MATTTPRLGLTKPGGGEVVDIAVLNHDFDLLDFQGTPNIYYGTGAQRLALDVTSIPNNSLYISTDEANSLVIRILHSGVWAPAAPANQHAERHIPGGADPLAWSTIHARGTLAARPAAGSTNANLFYFATDDNGGTLYLSNGTTWTQVGSPVNLASHGSTHTLYGTDAITVDARQLTGFSNLSSVPLGAADVFTSGPIATSGFVQCRYTIRADQDFTATVDTSSNGTSFSTGGTTYTTTAYVGGFFMTMTVTAATLYQRLAITNGATAMTSLSANVLPVNILGTNSP